jgi:hypothetical protein
MAKQKPLSRYIPKQVKEAVRRRDRDICQICFKTSEYMEYDHITPYSLGAPATIDNIQQLCRKCNLKKRNKTNNDCRKCGGWNPHNAKYCHGCGCEMPKAVKKNTSRNSSFFTELVEDIFDFEIIFWLLRKVIGIGLLLLALFLIYQSIRQK